MGLGRPLCLCAFVVHTSESSHQTLSVLWEFKGCRGSARAIAFAACPGACKDSFWNEKTLFGKKIMTTLKIPTTWEKWCKSGKHGRGARKKNAVIKCLNSGHVRGYFSDILLRPDLVITDSMYPSLEHLVDPKNHAEAVVEARIINDMKSHLSEGEFWKVIEHLFIVGVEKKKIVAPYGKKLPKGWSPARHYMKMKTEPKTPETTICTGGDRTLP